VQFSGFKVLKIARFSSFKRSELLGEGQSKTNPSPKAKIFLIK